MALRLPALFLAALLLAAGCSRGASPPRFWPVPDFNLTAAGPAGPAPIALRDLLGHVWIADFVFTACEGPCPMLSSEMARLQRALPSEVRLVSFTVDPEHDTPDVLRRYAARFGADLARWRFVTGEPSVVAGLVNDGFKLAAAAAPGAPPGRRVTHSTKLALVDAEGVVRGFYDGLDAGALEALRSDATGLARRHR